MIDRFLTFYWCIIVLKLVIEDFCFVSTNRENLSSDTYLGKLIGVGVSHFLNDLIYQGSYKVA